MLSFQKILPAAAFAVLLAFSAGHVDLPPQFFSKAVHAKTCCGRPVCQCKHARNAVCPFRAHKHAHEDHAAPARRPCHLKKENPAPAVSGVRTVPENKLPFFRQAPCHSEKAPASSPVHAREFFFSRPGIPYEYDASTPYFSPASPAYDFFFNLPIDRPPRVF